jgi:dihydrolipoamide dehydrogenase
MMMMGNKYNFSAQYDLCVIGGGPGGYVAAIKGGQLGLKTVCIEKRGSLGGTCLNVGCIPSKALLNISHKYEEANKHFKEMGIEVSNVSYDWDKVQEKKGKIVTSLTKGIEGLFKKNKVDYKVGWGVFEKKGEVNVLKENGEVETISAKNFIIATGSEPSPFPGLAFDEKVIVSSTGALSLQKVPERLVVIGGGVIGLEMGSVYARLGSKVTVIEYQDGITPGIDLEIAKTFQKILTK